MVVVAHCHELCGLLFLRMEKRKTFELVNLRTVTFGEMGKIDEAENWEMKECSEVARRSTVSFFDPGKG